ncbi:MAG: T9SS type A sorting domain-containing protein [Flavobacteriales bacterium]|nr:T9SS type A sorting domain-containing protein [Flavobacteriales bacterium]
MKNVLPIAALVGTLWTVGATAQSFNPGWSFPNGPVNAVLKDSANNVVYLGGDFDYVGPRTGPYSTIVDNSTGTGTAGIPEPYTQQPYNRVWNSIADGDNGWLVQGSIQGPGFRPLRRSLYQLDAGKQLTDFGSDAYVNGEIKALAVTADNLYIGGSFEVGNKCGPKPVSITTGTLSGTFPRVGDDGSVGAAIPDGAGGWILGGNFAQIGDQARTNLAWVDAAGAVKSLNLGMQPSPSNVFALALDGNTLYVGGSFTAIGGQPRSRIAAVDLNTGLVTPWNPGASETVQSLCIRGGSLYVGGGFTTIAGQARSYAASFDLSSGMLTPWAPQPNTWVKNFEPYGGKVYLAGAYLTSVAGSARAGLAAVDAVTGALDPWAPVINGQVRCLSASSTQLFVGGSFTTLNGQTRNRIGAFDLASGNLTAWNAQLAPESSQSMSTVVYKNGQVYAMGYVDYTNLWYSPVYSFNAATAQRSTWSPVTPLYGGRTMAVSDTEVYYLGAGYDVIGKYGRSIAAFNLSTGNYDARFDPFMTGKVNAMMIAGDVIYAGGTFSVPAPYVRSGLAAFNIHTGALSTWNPGNVTGTITCMAGNGDDLFLGGEFTKIGVQLRKNLAAVSMGTATILAPLPKPNQMVRCMATREDTLYLGGDFTQVGASSRTYAASVSTATGQILPWDPQPNGTVFALAHIGPRVAIGGSFTLLGGSSRLNFGTVDLATGTATSWKFNANAPVKAIAPSGGKTMIVGDFTQIGGEQRNNIVALNATTGKVTAWDPDANGTVRTLALSDGSLFIGGDFTTIGGQARSHIASLNPQNATLRTFAPVVDGPVNTIMAKGSALYFGGDFLQVNGIQRNHAASVWGVGGALRPWDPNVNGPVHALAFSGNTTVLGGAFTSVGGVVRNNAASVKTVDGSVTGWDPDVNGPIYALLPTDEAIFAGGQFSLVGGLNRRVFAALNTYTAKAMYPWNVFPSASSFDRARSLAVTDSTLLVGGYFNDVEGTTRYNLAAFNRDTKELTDLDLGPIREVNAMVVSGNQLLMGLGEETLSFTEYDDYFAVVELESPVLRRSGPLALPVAEIRVGLAPNPVAGQQVELTVTGLDAGTRMADVSVLNLNGQLVYTGKAPVVAGQLQLHLEGSEQFSPGVYIVQVSAGAQLQTQRLVVMQ